MELTTVPVTPGGTWVIGPHVGHLASARAKVWYREGDKGEEWQVPDYSVMETAVSPRPVEADRMRIPCETLKPQSYGHEIEMVAVTFDENDTPILVNIQNVLQVLGDYDLPAITPEAWVSQIEFPSSPRTSGSLYEYNQKQRGGMQKIIRIFDELGILLLPVGVIPIGGQEQANIQDPHILNTIMRGIGPHMDGRDNRTPAELLDGFRTNGLHITIKVQPDQNDLVGDERLNLVYNLTHGPIAVMMKAFTLNGNHFIEDLENGDLSTREKWRNTLPTAKVGPTYRLSSPEARKAVRAGTAPSLERAAMHTGPHNPVGRQKEQGMIEFTIFDMEPCQDKILALEIMLQHYVHIVDHAVLTNRVNDLIETIPKEYREVFLGVIEDNEEFLKLATAIDKYGYDTEIELSGGERRKVDIILNDFLDWLSRRTSDLANDTQETDFAVGYLQSSIINSKSDGPEDYVTYLRTGYGNAAMTTLKAYQRYLIEVGDPPLARDLTLKELALAWRGSFSEFVIQL